MEVLQEKYAKFLLMVLLQNHYVHLCVSEDQMRIVDSSAVYNDLAGAEAKFQFTSKIKLGKTMEGRALVKFKTENDVNLDFGDDVPAQKAANPEFLWKTVVRAVLHKFSPQN